VETNGSLPAPAGIDWICVSPKAGAPWLQRSGHELKVVWPQAGLDLAALEAADFQHRYLQPMDNPLRRANTERLRGAVPAAPGVASVFANPQDHGHPMTTAPAPPDGACFEITETFFDAAHTLQREIEAEGSRRIHGHTYHAQVTPGRHPAARHRHGGRPGTCVRAAIAELRPQLDHQLLDEVPGLGPATLENLAAFVWRGMQARLPQVVQVRVWREALGDGLHAALQPAAMRGYRASLLVVCSANRRCAQARVRSGWPLGGGCRCPRHAGGASDRSIGAVARAVPRPGA